MNTQATEVRDLRSVFRLILYGLGRLVRRTQDGEAAGAEVLDLQVLLESLPLTSDEFGIACLRLRNAQRYLRAEELGAARWELNALSQQLRARMNDEGREPRRRLRSGQ